MNDSYHLIVKKATLAFTKAVVAAPPHAQYHHPIVRHNHQRGATAIVDAVPHPRAQDPQGGPNRRICDVDIQIGKDHPDIQVFPNDMHGIPTENMPASRKMIVALTGEELAMKALIEDGLTTVDSGEVMVTSNRQESNSREEAA